MRCSRCDGTLANVQGYRQCQECGHVSDEAVGRATRAETTVTR
ncbi:MAG: hypothetical protein ACOCSP_02025 [archaeon]